MISHIERGKVMKLYMRILRKLIYLYKKGEEEYLQKALGQCGIESTITYPFTLTHPELIELGDKTVILTDCRMQVFPELTGIKAKISIGNNCLIGQRFCILAGEDVSIGNSCSIVSDVCIVSENHGINPCEEEPYGTQKLNIAPVRIEDECWIGERAIIMPGVTIGKRSVIGAGAVVTKSVPQYCVAVGNPAKIIKKFDFEQGKWVRV